MSSPLNARYADKITIRRAFFDTTSAIRRNRGADVDGSMAFRSSADEETQTLLSAPSPASSMRSAESVFRIWDRCGRPTRTRCHLQSARSAARQEENVCDDSRLSNEAHPLPLRHAITRHFAPTANAPENVAQDVIDDRKNSELQGAHA